MRWLEFLSGKNKKGNTDKYLVKPEEVIPGLRALIARDLIERHGFSRKKAAEILGLTPSAITLYLEGKRAGDLAELLLRSGAMDLVRRFTDLAVDKGGKIDLPALYDLALSAISLIERGSVVSGERRDLMIMEEERAAKLINLLRRRFEVEHRSAEEFLRIASKIRNQPLRMLIRMIARDCLKHADIMFMLMSVVERGGEMRIDVPDMELLNKLLEEERLLHTKGLDKIKELLPHRILTLLIDSIADDERKHEKILKSLRDYVEALP